MSKGPQLSQSSGDARDRADKVLAMTIEATQEEPDRCAVIDAIGPPEAVAARIMVMARRHLRPDRRESKA